MNKYFLKGLVISALETLGINSDVRVEFLNVSCLKLFVNINDKNE